MSIEIQLLGQKIHFKVPTSVSTGSSDHAETAQAKEKQSEHLKEVAALVNRHLKHVQDKTKSNIPHHVALLALMDLAEEYLAAKKRTLAYKQDLSQKAQEIISSLDVEFK
jgi:cell division protein ZapA (FtsZ GTPase activity inhibitor)